MKKIILLLLLSYTYGISIDGIKLIPSKNSLAQKKGGSDSDDDKNLSSSEKISDADYENESESPSPSMAQVLAFS